MVTTASGEVLSSKRNLRLREKELSPILKEFHKLTEAKRKPQLPDPATAKPPRRPLPKLPKGGMAIEGFCTYLDTDNQNSIRRAQRFYYEKNPDRWEVETQSDTLWLKESEWKSLLPQELSPGRKHTVSQVIQNRFYSTIGIDYMEGSVNSLPVRKSTMHLTVKKVTSSKIQLELAGYAYLGKEFDITQKNQARSRGSELRIEGKLEFDSKKQKFTRFDIVGVGSAWGNKMNYTNREVLIRPYPWLYGIACKLITGDSPKDKLPPYNLIHYGSAGAYFPKK